MFKSLLDNKFAPITFSWGFIESDFAKSSEAFRNWQSSLSEQFGARAETKTFSAPLAGALSALEILTTPQDRYLLVETRSCWTAVFSNGLRTNDVFGPVSYLPTVLKCRGLSIACTPDRSQKAREALQAYGAVEFAIYGPNATDWLNRIRIVSAVNDLGGWQFVEEGDVQPYEITENYRKTRIVDRFTPELLERYCEALQIDLFNESFYAGRCCLIHVAGRSGKGPAMTLTEARMHVDV